MKTFLIHIQGQVQGVGFRPFVYQLARRYGLSGWVGNRTDGVRIALSASSEELDRFLDDLLRHHPKVARVTGHRVQEVPYQRFDGFSIAHSRAGDQTQLLLTPDLGLCLKCREEMADPASRRRGYAFTNCTHCGPRYSIIRSLPYDRATTAMEPFTFCPECQREYEDPDDRRYHAQATSCPQCGITLALYDQQQHLLTADQSQVILSTAEKIQEGAIVAIKGVGGYLLLCDAAHAGAIQTLRARKNRPTKPFALMYPGLSLLRADVPVSPAEQELLTGVEAPIVLLPGTPAMKQRVAASAIAPGLDQFGVMLPYAPLFVELMRCVDRPLVATSGNVSGSPIVYTDEAAVRQLSSLADYRLTYHREIVVPQDDSVVRFTPDSRQRILLRRSRGLAPTYVPAQLYPDLRVLATGAELKSTFAYAQGGNIYISQYLGDLGSFDAQETYRRVAEHLLSIFGKQPEVVLTDRHPQYFATRYGVELAETCRSRLVSVPHHEAHLAAVLGEHDLLDTREPVLGVVWDGTGLGRDGQIWGGEFFRYHRHRIDRVAHIAYYRHLMGDKMAREPRLPALSLVYSLPGSGGMESHFTKIEWQHYSRQLEKPGLMTSSVGRLFDATASLLGLMDKVSYEGEAALRLETLATRYVAQQGCDELESYFPQTLPQPPEIPTGPLFEGMLADLPRTSREYIAARFHYSLADLVRQVARREQVSKVACSGGVFQNALLVDMIQRQLPEDVTLYWHEQLSPNDENISFGQLMHYQIQQKQSTAVHEQDQKLLEIS